MDVKDAVSIAKTYVAELFANEGLSNLGLEEVEFDDSSGAWRVVTPNTLTETSNLIGQIEDPARTQIRGTFRQVIGATEEEYVPSLVVTSTSHFLRLGLTDAGLLQLMSGSRSLLTTDVNSRTDRTDQARSRGTGAAARRAA